MISVYKNAFNCLTDAIFNLKTARTGLMGLKRFRYVPAL